MAPTLPGTTLNLTFTAPPPGLSPVVDFVLSPVEGAVGLFTLRDTGDADLRLFLVDPAVFVPEYAPVLTEEHRAAVGAPADSPISVYVVATIAETGPVVNLLAPMLVDEENGSAAQVILEGDWPLRAELIAPAA